MIGKNLKRYTSIKSFEAILNMNGSDEICRIPFSLMLDPFERPFRGRRLVALFRYTYHMRYKTIHAHIIINV